MTTTNKKDKYGYDIPDKANIMHVRTSKNTNPDQEKIFETANILIDKVMEIFPDTPPQAVNILLTALDYYFIREMQNQIEKHERGETPMYISISASIMNARRNLEETSMILKAEMEDIIEYLKNKPKLTADEMKIMSEKMLKDGFLK